MSDRTHDCKEKKDIERIFSPFERAEEQRNHTIEGNGLGLAITRKLVRLMGGEISVRSEFGKGSVFEVQILQRIVHEKNGENVLKLQNREKHEDTHISAPDAKILVVDDVETNRIVVKELLRVTDINVEVASSGEMCLELMKNNRYDLVLLDHMMPGMDGIETLKLIRKMENSPNKDTPVIAMTANAVLGAKSMYQSDLQNKTSKVIIKELKEMFDRIDFHVREPEAGNSHIPAWAKEEHMEQSVSEKEFWSYEITKNEETRL